MVALVIVPSGSLLEFALLGSTLHVRCPGCDSRTTLAAHRGGTLVFAHEDRCTVHARIKDAIRAYERQVAGHG